MRALTSTGLLLLSLTLGACSSSDDGGDAEAGQAGSPQPMVSANGPESEMPSGRFIDSAVQGLQYDTATRSARTDSEGNFTYAAAESIVFSIGDIELPPVVGSELVTPLSVFATDDISRPEVVNLARLLQSLDIDANPENGITIDEQAHQNATGLTVDFASADFDSQVANLVANSGSANSALIEAAPALAHLSATLAAEGIGEGAGEPAATTPPGALDACTSDSPLVGNTSEFSTLAHEVSGTLEVVDDCTLRITSFNYDGGGPSVYFYLGAGGDYSAAGGARLVGPQLNGRVWENETILVTLPDDVNIDDFDGISVWCDDFNADFGNAPLL